MTRPTTKTGMQLAEGRDDRTPFVARIVAIEHQAAAAERSRLEQAVRAADIGDDADEWFANVMRVFEEREP